MTKDIPDLAKEFSEDPDGLQECITLIQKELERIRLHPEQQGKGCVYEPLKSAGYRKVKLFSSKALRSEKGSKPDLRLIYKYDQSTDTVRVESVGFRVKETPRPAHDPYSKAKSRVLERQSS